MVYVDSNCNRITVAETGRTAEGVPLVVARLVDDPACGYLASVEGEGGFGTEECPSSYNRPCATWFGKRERFPTAEDALAALADPQ